MQVADPIIIEIAGEAHELRPTLRAAACLVRRHGDFATIYKAILADHLTIVCDVVRHGTGSRQAADYFLIEHEIPGLRAKLDGLKLQLLRYVLALAGHDGSNPQPNAPAGKPMSFADYHAELFRIGTGWLGWPPEETWNAAPAEIIAARAGRVDMIEAVLKAVFGNAPETEPDHYTPERLTEVITSGSDPTFDRQGYAALRAKMGKLHA